MSLIDKSRSAFVWASVQQIGVVVLNLSISILLARILEPEEFGLIGMITVFISVGNVLMSGGLGASIIRTQNPTHRELSTVFFSNLIFSLFFYTVIFFIAPYVAAFFERPVLVLLIRVYSIAIILFSFSAVQYARLTQSLNFKLAMRIKLPSIVFGGAVGLGCAYTGFGVWSLVAMYLAQATADSVQLWFRSGWMPTFVFSKTDFKKHFNFGVNITMLGIINAFYANIYNIIIGKNFSAVQLGYYTRSFTLSQLPVSNIQEVITKVTYPIMSTIQDDNVKLRRAYETITQSTMLIIFPILALGVILAEPLFSFFLTDKWLPAVPYFQLLCLAGIFVPLSANNFNILKVKGKSKLILKLGVVEKIVISIGIIYFFRFGIVPLLCFKIAISALAFIFNARFCGGSINYGALSQLKDFCRMFFICAFAGLLAYGAFIFVENNLPDILTILLVTLVFLCLYAASVFIFAKNIFMKSKTLILRKQLNNRK